MPKKPCIRTTHKVSHIMGIKSSTHRPLVPMESSARLYHCAKCHAQVMICQNCDRGNRYCFEGCAAKARVESFKRASEKYRLTRQARLDNAARQKAFRLRQKQKVTHQGSQQSPTHDVLLNTTNKPDKTTKTTKLSTSPICHHCGCPCSHFLRLNFINTNRYVSRSLH